jgi:cysteine desulfurase
MLPYFTESFGNASSVYELSNNNRKAIANAREIVAKAINAKDDEIYFTSGGTEADNWAIKGIAEAYRAKGKHIITSQIEHHAVLHTCEYLEKHGYEVTYLPVDEFGRIRIEDLQNAIKDTTTLITIMFANNEIGTVQNIKEIGDLARANKIIFHTDAVQAFMQEDIDVVDMNIDALSISAHKIYGPKGVGAMYLRKGVKIGAFMHGGAQERHRRAGTENVPGIVGLGKAIEIASSDMNEKNARQRRLRDRLIDELLEKIPYARLNGHRTERLSNNANISFRFIEGEALLILLDMNGVCGSSGSACTSGSLDPSHVLLAIGLPHEIAHGSLRLTVGDSTTDEDIDKVLEVVPGVVERLRQMSPLYEDFLKNGSKE